MNASTIYALLGAGAALVAITAALVAWVGRPLRRLAKQNDEFREDWYGRPARPGHDAQPGVMERLSGIERELRPGGDGAIPAAIVRLDARLARLEEHIRLHQPPS
jgi:hypothetical protein